MAAACLLVLVAVGAARAMVPEPCQGVLTSPCQDVTGASGCHEERCCCDLWDSLATQDVTQGAAAVPGGKKKCSLCTKILERLKAMAGEDPDEEAVAAALGKGCRALGKRLGRFCKWLVRKKREQISRALREGTEPRLTCTALGLCRA